MAEEMLKTEVLHSTGTATADGNSISVSGYDTLLFNVSQIGTATVTFEATDDNTNWFAINAVNLTTNTAATTATTTGLYRTSVTGVRYVRGRISAYTAGTVKVNVVASTGDGASAASSGAASGTTVTVQQGTITDVSNLAKGTITRVEGGTIGLLSAGTITAVNNLVTGTVAQVTSVSNLAAGTLTALASGTVAGGVAHNAADSGNPIKTGGKYNASAPTLDDGDRGDTQLDVNGNTKITAATLYAGEDLTNNVHGVLLKPVAASTYSPSSSISMGAVVGAAAKTSAGAVYSVYASNANASTRYLQIFNGTAVPANGGTPRFSFPISGTSSTYPVPALKLENTFWSPSEYLGTGITWAISSTNGTYGTASVTASEHTVVLRYI